MTRISLPAILLLAGCSWLPASGVDTLAPPPMENEACRTEATQSPEARNVGREANFQNPANLRRIAQERNDALSRVYTACLRRAGLPLPGGVERVRREP